MRKQRRTQEEMDTLRGAIYAVAQVDRPVSIRHIFYRMVTQDLVEKSDLAYQRVQKISVDMRRARALPYGWIEDSSRRAYWKRSIGAALEGYGLPVLKAGTTQRVAYATTAAQGMTVFDERRTVARREMEAVRDEIKELIHGAESKA